MGRPRKQVSETPGENLEEFVAEPFDDSIAVERYAVPTRAEMVSQGFRYITRGVCGSGFKPGCKQSIEFWRSPKNKEIAVNPMPEPSSLWHPHLCGGAGKAKPC